ncbi:hypothetical protein VTJ04DRAFT_1488 [Mycothermus thermophilus]|uniref:uncharacterized protein n=1 Tax=Humicola insolens TaxID=85995 RepID=UPI0037429095
MTADEEPQPTPAPTFAGRLDLNNFKFNNDTMASGLRRSPRFLSNPSLTTPAAARKSPSPAKRKPAAEADDTTTKSEEAPDSQSSSSTSSSQPTAARRKPKRAKSSPTTYAPPAQYSHLPPGIPDSLGPNLLVFFIGLNPGVETARRGHAYAHPSNLFWKLLHSSGITPRRCDPSEDRSMPERYALGLTNIVGRPSRSGAELSKSEMDAGVAVLEAKVRKYRPEAVCIVGKSIWESVWRVRHGRAIGKEEFRYGWQEETENMGLVGGEDGQEEERVDGVVYDPKWKGARIFVATSTSGLAASLRPAEKEAIWKELGDWVVERRKERAKEGDKVAAKALEEAGIKL